MVMFTRWIIRLMFMMFITFTSNASAEVKTYSGTGEYIMSEFETLDVAKQRAKQIAERDAQEQAGVYVDSYTKVNNSQVTEEEIVTMTSGIINVIDVQYKLTPLSDSKSLTIRADIKANINSEDINKWLEKSVRERSALSEQNKELQKANAEQEKIISDLRKQLSDVKTQQDRERLTREYAEADRIFLANQKFEEAGKFYEKGDFQSVIKLCSQAIEINPHSANAYGGRGIAHTHFKRFNNAISDLTKAIQIDPNLKWAYSARAMAYYFSHAYMEAIFDFDIAIQDNLNAAILYQLRGLCFQHIGNNTLAERDFITAKSLGYGG